MQEVYGLSEDILAGAMGFGGGIGRCQSVCGAISGGVIALGHHNARTSADVPETRAKTRDLARELYETFAAKFGRTDCRSLTGYDFTASGGYDEFHRRDEESGERFCNPYVEFSVRFLMERYEE